MKRCLLPLIVALAVFAQDSRLAEVQGEILDMQGKPIFGAQVVYTNLDNGKTYSMKTDQNGRFHAVGLLLGTYSIQVAGPTGKRIFSGKRAVFAGDQAILNVIHIDLSMVPTRASLVPFKGPQAFEAQSEKWRKAAQGGVDLNPAQREQLREENFAIARYNELLPQVQAALKAQQWADAMELLQKMIALAPFQWELYQNLGTVQALLGQYKQAAESFDKAGQLIDLDPRMKSEPSKMKTVMAQMLVSEGEAYAAAGKPEAAAIQYRKATEVDPGQVIPLLHLCMAEYNSENPEGAVSACKRAVAADPSRPESYQLLGSIQMNLGRYQDALETYAKGIRLEETGVQLSAYLHTNINSIERQGNPELTIHRTRAGQMLLSAGNAYFQMRKFKEAAQMFARAAELHPFPALAYFNLCATLFDMNNLKGAAEACDKAILLNPRMAEAYFVKATALYGEGSRHGQYQVSGQAAAALAKYLELAPEGEHADDARSMLKLKGAGGPDPAVPNHLPIVQTHH